MNQNDNYPQTFEERVREEYYGMEKYNSDSEYFDLAAEISRNPLRLTTEKIIEFLRRGENA